MTPPSTDSDPAQALQALRESRRVILASHVRPDADGIGSQAGLARILAALGKQVAILNPDPPSPRFDFFTDGLEYGVYEGGELPEHDACVLLDISELSRCGDLGLKLGAAPSVKIVVDHHIHHGDVWWDHAYVDVKASATGLLVYRIAKELGVALEPRAASALFAAIAADTGWFKYSNTDAETLAAAADLVASGVEPSALYAALHQRERIDQPRWIAELLASARFHAEGRLAVVAVPASSPAAEEVDTDTVLDVLRSVESIEVVILVRELEEGRCKASLRSKTDFDVNEVARAFGGGGHRKASGATLTGTLEAVSEELVRATLERLSAGLRGGAA